LANYNVVCKVIVANASSIEAEVANYINSLDSSKVIRAFSAIPIGASRVYVIIVHDA